MITDCSWLKNQCDISPLIKDDISTYDEIKSSYFNKNTEGYKIVNTVTTELVGIVTMDTVSKSIEHIEVYGKYKEQTFGKVLIGNIIQNGATNVKVSKDNRKAINLFELAGFRNYKDDGYNYNMSREFKGGF